MFESFTRSAQRAMALADEEARELDHNYIGTEHLLLGLLREQEGIVVRVLEVLDVAPEKVREQVVRVVGSDETGIGDRRPLTPRARRVLGSASQEALRLGHDHVDAGHILLGLVGESEGVAAHVLHRLGLDPDGVRREVARALSAQEEAAGGAGRESGLPHATAFRARVEGLVVQARCGVSDEERTVPQPLSLDLCYSYEAGGGDDLDEIVDYGAVIEGVAGLLKREEFRLLETGTRMVAKHVLSEFPPVQEITVTITKLRASTYREVSGVWVEATFYR